MTQAPILWVNNLSVTIQARTETVGAVENATFAVKPGQTLALVGESGSGKTMTAMSLVGLAPAGTQVRTSGTAKFMGRDLLTLAEEELRRVRGRQIGIVFQDPGASLNPLMTVGSQILEALGPDFSRHSGRERVEMLLEEVGLAGIPGIFRRYPHEVSGGQQQRMAIAMALAGDPKLIIADEPTTALDMTVQAQILDLIRRVRESRQMALLLITHDLGIVADMADDVIVMRKGRVVEQGPTSAVLSRPRTDYTRGLLACRPRIDLPRSAGLQPPVAAGEKPAAGQPILSVRGLSVAYGGRGLFAPPFVAVDRVSFDVPQRWTIGLVGESGSGKSTIGKALVGLVHMSSGSILFDGSPLPDPARMTRARRAKLQYIFQDSHGALNPRLTVEQAVGEAFAISGYPRRDRRAKVLVLLDEVGLSAKHLERYPSELSGGQRQRLTIARALALSPKLLICDEIVSSLDVSVQAQVLNLLKKIQAERGLSLIFISHDLAVVSEICASVIVLNAGRIIEEGPVDVVFRRPSHTYTNSLLAAGRELEAKLPEQAALETA
ncbi:ABC transporter ATP-binding protein [Chelativorans sp.]|uniref:ABC transporter ATP-binding protein n=1 Tax=Chelativorans sp. TaxID=2203393 RepID=UPI0028113990|nr:ABC transporter ATP-binding protein [Chelativorans sp.]